MSDPNWTPRDAVKWVALCVVFAVCTIVFGVLVTLL